jgi:RNA polymerase sigma-70 factor (ECF subfamily)
MTDESPIDRVLLVDALQRIPQAQRRVVVLTHLYDLSLLQVAEEVGVPVGTVKSRLNRGLAALAQLVDEDVDVSQSRDEAAASVRAGVQSHIGRNISKRGDHD